MNPSAATYPMPVALVGTQVNGRPNYMAGGWISQANMNMPILAMAMSRSRLTADAMLKNRTFSVNLPSE